ncbi:hypothetical protein [Halarsenatibacter silvermanii]|uniref:Uncharacterized protein n=1 Tax=Halarsenatibacter silvermanii TaxID=321763 RepID=A0A1G9T0P5_9FIRM|nr:hypothetical protein [Halarsenatibacter silvermanii]SDM41269.1 hypothetical protein SAMN04488692_1333 [Halarsenatibacter silvermanii]
MISRRVKLSLYQLISEFPFSEIMVLIEKYTFGEFLFSIQHNKKTDYFLEELKEIISESTEEAVLDIIDEILRVRRTYRNKVNPKYKFDERWGELKRCLLLEGLKIEEGELKRVEPEIEGSNSAEENLKKEILNSDLQKRDDIVLLIENSSDAFIKPEPDFNGSLSNIRTALETLAKSIAKKIIENAEEDKEISSWGVYISYLKSKDFIGENEEDALTGVYSLLSELHHPLVGFSEEELTSFARAMGLRMCYFLIKKYNGG